MILTSSYCIFSSLLLSLRIPIIQSHDAHFFLSQFLLSTTVSWSSYHNLSSTTSSYQLNMYLRYETLHFVYYKAWTSTDSPLIASLQLDNVNFMQKKCHTCRSWQQRWDNWHKYFWSIYHRVSATCSHCYCWCHCCCLWCCIFGTSSAFHAHDTFQSSLWYQLFLYTQLKDCRHLDNV